MYSFKKLSFVLVLASFLFASSLWTDKSSSPYVKDPNYKVGDTVTVIIDENLSALQSGSTNTNKSSNLGFGFDTKNESSLEMASKEIATKGDSKLNISGKGSSKFQGKGSTTRKSAIKTTITAAVIDVQPDGKIFVLGQKQIRINEEVENIEVSGLVRVADISDENTVLSSQIANIKVAINGVGVVANQQKPGFLSRALDWLF